MADVYKFRVTVDVEIATRQHPKVVRDFLRTRTEDVLAALVQQPRGDTLEKLMAFHVRTKRLDDWAYIGPEVSLKLPQVTCPHCKSEFREVTINRLPFICPICQKVIPVDAEGRVRG